MDDHGGSPADPVTFTMNGRRVSLIARPFTTLADALRTSDDTGTKIGCDAGDCGACTVLLDGDAVCACLVPLGQVQDRRVETVEGVHNDPLGERLVNAFSRHGAAQCGICTPGMMQAARALLTRNAAPTRADAEAAIGGVLCRCTGYIKIVDAICDAPHERWGGPAAGGVGARLRHVDALHKARGDTEFGADFAPEGALMVARDPLAVSKRYVHLRRS